MELSSQASGYNLQFLADKITYIFPVEKWDQCVDNYIIQSHAFSTKQ